MSFTCRYCGKKFCSEHRLPENHDCEAMDQAIEKEKEETSKWFQEKEVKNTPPKRTPKPSILQDILGTFKTNYTLSIILFTSLVFLLQLTIGPSPENTVFYDLFVLQPGLEDVVSQPWTVITVMFLHASILHIFANMITLYFFGTALEKLIGSKRFLKFYFLSGIAASIGFIVFRNFLAAIYGAEMLGPAVGASGAVVAVFAAVAMLYPRADILLFFVIPMKIKTGLYLFGAFETANIILRIMGQHMWPFASSAHLTGLLVGIYFGKKLQNEYARKTSRFNPLEY